MEHQTPTTTGALLGPGQLRADVELLAAAPRPAGIGDPQHARARSHLTARLTRFGAQPYSGGTFELPYRAQGRDFTNIVACITGRDPDADPVLLGAHYDSCCGTPGASDNAAAVALALAVAERLVEAPASRTVVIALFDAEEPDYFHSPAMGSTRFYEDQRQGEVRCAVILDLLGHPVPIPDAEDALFVAGAESDSALLDLVGSTPEPDGLSVGVVLHEYAGDMSDHTVFRANGRPFLFLTEARWADYHQPTDTPDRIDFDKLSAEVDYVETLVRGACDRAEQPPATPSESLPIEAGSLRRVIPAAVRHHLGVGDLETRGEITKLANLLTAVGL